MCHSSMLAVPGPARFGKPHSKPNAHPITRRILPAGACRNTAGCRVNSRNQCHLGDCLDIMRLMPANSVDSIVTDPPYGLSDHKPGEVERSGKLEGKVSTCPVFVLKPVWRGLLDAALSALRSLAGENYLKPHQLKTEEEQQESIMARSPDLVVIPTMGDIAAFGGVACAGVYFPATEILAP